MTVEEAPKVMVPPATMLVVPDVTVKASLIVREPEGVQLVVVAVIDKGPLKVQIDVAPPIVVNVKVPLGELKVTNEGDAAALKSSLIVMVKFPAVTFKEPFNVTSEPAN